MRAIREGLNQYMVREHIQNEYFKKIEYEVIHQNSLQVFLGMQLRQQDTAYSLLYDITGVQTIDEITQKRDLKMEDCCQLLEHFRGLLQIVEDYMLEIDHISFSKDRIYQTKNGDFKMYYDPDEAYNVEEDIVELFAWMLSRLDYRDQQGVRLIYHTYDLVRNQGFSILTVEEALSYAEEKEEMADSYLAEKEDMECETEEIIPEVHKVSAMRILPALGFICSLALTVYWISKIIRYGWSVTLLQFLTGSLCLLLFFGILLKGHISDRKQELQNVNRS